MVGVTECINGLNQNLQNSGICRMMELEDSFFNKILIIQIF
jgi:hypothetical protein